VRANQIKKAVYKNCVTFYYSSLCLVSVWFVGNLSSGYLVRMSARRSTADSIASENEVGACGGRVCEESPSGVMLSFTIKRSLRYKNKRLNYLYRATRIEQCLYTYIYGGYIYDNGTSVIIDTYGLRILRILCRIQRVISSPREPERAAGKGDRGASRRATVRPYPHIYIYIQSRVQNNQGRGARSPGAH
jgi:hypothetical protein